MFIFDRAKYAVVILGPAGSGKSTLISAFSKWLTENGISVKCINLDPGAEYIPYQTAWDIRKYFTISQIMKERKLGPNGAIIEAMNLLFEKSQKFIEEISKLKAEYLLIDTPGQLEVFAFRDVGLKFINLLQKKLITQGVFLIDGEMFNDVVSLVVAKVLSLAVELKLSIPLVSIINKGDLVDPKVIKLMEDPDKVKEEIIKSNQGELIDVALYSLDLITKLQPALRTVVVSSKKNTGFNELFDLLHELFCTCGDLT